MNPVWSAYCKVNMCRRTNYLPLRILLIELAIKDVERLL